ncbi:MAG: trypsin-like peptidase domain-containing protein [Clostridiales bacterium]|nr:trypsin-like peptidase domain-containing protein [Clostridiales bacterium]
MYYNDYNRTNDEQQPIVTDNYKVDGQDLGRKKSKKPGVRTVALCLVCALAGGLVGGGAVRVASTGSLFGGSTTIYESTHAPVAVTMSNVSTDQPMTGAEVYAANVGSAVGITTELVTTNFWGQKVKGAAAGSGFVITQDGYILTNYHVIDGASSIKVAFVDGTTYDATLVGGEEANDIAVLKIDTTGLTPVKLGDSDNLVVGEQVCAIGNPLGELTFTYTSGSVSAKDRSITMENGEVMNMLQTDTAINSGNSGGPLFNMYGEVIGITSAKYSSSSSSNASVEGIGFAIPINDVKDMVTDIIEKGYVTGKPNVGILMNDVSTEATQRYGIPAGAYVEAVLKGSCGEKAGLKTGDVITAVNDTAVTSSGQLASAVKNYKAGDTVTFTVYRNGQNTSISVTLDENDKAREEAMSELQEDYQASQQQDQSSSQQGGSTWPFGFGW